MSVQMAYEIATLGPFLFNAAIASTINPASLMSFCLTPACALTVHSDLLGEDRVGQADDGVAAGDDASTER